MTNTVLISKDSIKGTSLEFKWPLLLQLSMRNKSPVEELMYRISLYYDVKISDVMSRSRKRNLVNVRIIYAYLASKVLPMKLNESTVAMVLRKDRSSSYHYYKSFEDMFQTDSKFKSSVVDFVEHNYPESLNNLLNEIK